MWTCPQCGRTFHRTNQGHYCSNVPTDVDGYIASVPEYAQATAQLLAETLRREVPGISECIKWSMPSFLKGKAAVQFAANKTFLSFYVGSEVLSKIELGNIKSKKDALYIPYDQPFPEELVVRILRHIFGNASTV